MLLYMFQFYVNYVLDLSSQVVRQDQNCLQTELQIYYAICMYVNVKKTGLVHCLFLPLLLSPTISLYGHLPFFLSCLSYKV